MPESEQEEFSKVNLINRAILSAGMSEGARSREIEGRNSHKGTVTPGSRQAPRNRKRPGFIGIVDPDRCCGVYSQTSRIKGIGKQGFV